MCHFKEKLLLKPESSKTTQISAPPCAFLICVATSWINDFKYVLFLSLLLLLMLFLLFLCHMANFNHGQKSLGQSKHNFNSMRFTSNVVKDSAVILQIHVPCPFPTQ